MTISNHFSALSIVFISMFISLGCAASEYCKPDQDCWPSPQKWEILNTEVHGRLVNPVGLLAPCMEDSKNKKCLEALKKARDPFLLQEHPEATQTTGMLGAFTSLPSPYIIAAENSADIAAGVKFAAKHNIKLVIKGAGHDYLGRSNSSDSLLIWTHNMRNIEMIDAFLPKGCKEKYSGVPAVTVEAGARWLEVYEVVGKNGGRYVQGGSCTSVGAAGGFIQGGGFGKFSRMYGTGASNVLQFEVVTSDGKTVTANECQNQDLFWALRGGGGGTFGVVTKLTMRTHELPNEFGSINATIIAKTDQGFQKLLHRFISFVREELSSPYWGDYVKVMRNNKLIVNLSIAGLSEKESKAIWKSFEDWVSDQPESYQISLSFRTWPAQEEWSPGSSVKRGINNLWWTSGDEDGVSQYIYGLESRWIPSHHFESESVPALVKALFEASRQWDLMLFLGKGQYGATAEAIERGKKTSMNPVVFDSPLLVIIPAIEARAFPNIEGHEPNYKKGREEAERVHKAGEVIRKATPDSGSYVNEASYNEPNWQESFWGVNYSRLLEIKKKYDPKNVFSCHHCVGSEGLAN